MIEDVERLLHALWIGTPGTSLRDEDRKKARELAGLLREIALVTGRIEASKELVIVEAAAGKGYVSLLARALVPRAAGARLVAIERDPRRIELLRAAAAVAGSSIDAIAADVADPSSWPEAPDVAIALHACGDASDLVIDRATAVRARWILVAPCCVAGSLPSARRAAAHADALSLPRSGALRRGLIETWVMSERMLALESRGWRTELVPFCAPTVTPHHLLLRGERISDPSRMTKSQTALASLLGTRTPPPTP